MQMRAPQKWVQPRSKRVLEGGQIRRRRAHSGCSRANSLPVLKTPAKVRALRRRQRLKRTEGEGTLHSGCTSMCRPTDIDSAHRFSLAGGVTAVPEAGVA